MSAIPARSKISTPGRGSVNNVAVKRTVAATVLTVEVNDLLGTAIWPRPEASSQISVRVHLPFVLTNQAAALTALGDQTRRAIVACLAERPRAVGELADELPVSRPAVSQHLKVLKDAGLVTDRAAGTRRIYRLNPAGIGALRDQLETFWNRALASYKDVVEESREESS
jgi:DNA-binding transcriptional ArsR family regulator